MTPRRYLQRTVLRTRRTPLSQLWRILYTLAARGAAGWVSRQSDTTIFLTGSMATGDPTYGLSDIDLVAVVTDPAQRERTRRRVERMHAMLPLLRRLVAHVWIYEPTELRAAAAAPYPTYGLRNGAAAFCGRQSLPDAMGLLERPGLRAPRDEWVSLRGNHGAPAPVRTHQDQLLAAWLELQYRWRYAVGACVERGPDLGLRMSTLLAAAAGVWLCLAKGEHAAKRGAALARAASLLPEESEFLLTARRLHEVSLLEVPAPMDALWGCFVRISRRIAEELESEACRASHRQVELVGAGDVLPLLDWRALALPPVRWSGSRLPTAAQECFVLTRGDPQDPGVVEDAARRSRPERWNTLRSGPLLVRPTVRVWDDGRLRGVELPASDPVSFALLAGEPYATFPEVPGWSALDRARRAVAEHRAWMDGGQDTPERRPGWVGGRPPVSWATPATYELLLSSARAGLFLDSLQTGSPRLTLTHEATVAALVDRDSAALEPGEAALEMLASPAPDAQLPDYEQLTRLAEVVRQLPAYETPALLVGGRR